MNTVEEFCRACGYPEEACRTFCRAHELLARSPEAAALLEENTGLLWAGAFRAPGEELVRLDRIARLTGIHPYTVYQLFYILCAPRTKQLYEQRGLPMDVCRSSLLSLKWKMNKTHILYGVWGVRWGDWFRPFFTLARFGIGRLEVECVPALVGYRNGALSVEQGGPVVNVHIPASGPLTKSVVLDSYRQAAAFFADRFPSGAVPFQCESWILDPRISALFPEGNLRAFCADYDVAAAGIDPECDDRWRVFLVPDTVPVAEYPEDTSLRRSLKRWLLDGNRMGLGIGLFFLRDGQVLPHAPDCRTDWGYRFR